MALSSLTSIATPPHNPEEARTLGVSMIYQELTLAPHLRVFENIFLGIEEKKYGLAKQKNMKEKSAKALQTLGHEDILPLQITGSCSIGERQIIEIARAIVSGARVIIFDEPTSSLSPEDTEKLLYSYS